METPPSLPPILSAPEPTPPLPPDIADQILSRRPASAPPPTWWYVLVAAAGLLQLVLSLVAPDKTADAAERLGMILGLLVIWPLVVIGLFSIGKRFRTIRTRTTILLVMWGLGILTSLANIGSERLRRHHLATQSPAGAPAAVSNAPAPASPARPQVAFTAPAPAAPAPDAQPGYDFSPGSDERLGKLIEGTREASYHDVVAGYRQACAARPHDAVLALEQVRFIERFAYSEDITIESASDDLAAAVAYMQERFPEAPGTILYNLRQIYDDTFEAKADEAARLIARWGDQDLAEFFLLRAQHCDDQKSPVRLHTFAEQSFSAHPTPEAGLLLARALHSSRNDRDALETLVHPVFESATPWLKRQKMDLLFDLGAREDARTLFEELRAANQWSVTNEDTASRLARSGEIELARGILHEMPLHDYNREKLLLARYRFELEHGTTAQAAAAYREYRALGLATDPFLRHRITLLRHHPAAGWTLQDLGGALLLLALLAGAAALPLVVLAPVHYWSLLRSRRGKAPGWADALWGLRAAWLAWGALCVVEVAIIWTYLPNTLQVITNPAAATESPHLRLPVLASLLGAEMLCAVVLLAHRRAWRLLGPGTWSLGRTIGLGLGIAFGLRAVLRVYLLFLPASLLEQKAAAIAPTLQVMLALRDQLGPIGLFGTVALLGPILEEVLFRGLLLQSVARHIPFLWANVLQAALFALAHQNLPLFPFYLAMALFAGLFAKRSGGLLAPIILHVANNALACVWVMLMK